MSCFSTGVHVIQTCPAAIASIQRQSLAVALAFAAIAAYGFYRSFGAQPLFARAILDD